MDRAWSERVEVRVRCEPVTGWCRRGAVAEKLPYLAPSSQTAAHRSDQRAVPGSIDDR
jgi:hypothetical protein